MHKKVFVPFENDKCFLVFRHPQIMTKCKNLFDDRFGSAQRDQMTKLKTFQNIRQTQIVM